MSRRACRLLAKRALVVALAAGAGTTFRAWSGEGGPPGQIGSKVVTWAEASPRVAGWGEMRTYFRGETRGTTSALAAIAVVKPGESVHPAHRHAEEEYLVITEGSGRWHLDGKEFPAAKGDVLHAAPWAMHGLVNTGDVPLTFFVARWNSKGLEVPPAPGTTADDRGRYDRHIEPDLTAPGRAPRVKGPPHKAAPPAGTSCEAARRPGEERCSDPPGSFMAIAPRRGRAAQTGGSTPQADPDHGDGPCGSA